MKKDILICGVGGQGTVLASKIIAASARMKVRQFIRQRRSAWHSGVVR